MFSEGDTIGAYELIRRLGGGAFGQVWLVRHVDLGVERAMKIPTDPDYVRQLRQEGKIQFQLHHPNIVETAELNTMHDPPFFVMEYVKGQDFRQHLKGGGSLSVAAALDVMHQVLEALKHAHSQGVLHGDLKPENILSAFDGTVKITDFGLGRVQADVAQSLLLSGSMMSSQGVSISGTYDYMSPEQRAGQDADPRDDLYSVGIIGCELLTGGRPSALGIARSMGRSHMPPRLIGVFEKACDARESRYASAAEMQSAIAALMQGVGGDLKGPPRLVAPPPPVVTPLPQGQPRPPVQRPPTKGRRRRGMPPPPPNTEGLAVLWFIREPQQILGALSKINVIINGSQVAQLRNDTAVAHPVMPGRYVLSVSSDGGFFGGATAGFTAAAGQEIVWTVAYTWLGKISLTKS